jgi:hypothetical protein
VVAQAQPLGDLAHDCSGDLDGLVGHPHANLDPACGNPVLAGKDGSDHEWLVPGAPRP